MSFKEGDFVYHVEQALLGTKLRIKRQVLLTWDPQADHYEIGDSKDRRSICETGFTSRGLGLRTATPVEAVNLYVSTMTRGNERRIKALEKEIEKLRAETARLLKLDHSKMKVEHYPDDWTPCDI